MEDLEKYNNRHKNINRGYRKLDIWKEAIDLYVFVKKEVNKIRTLPYKVRSQIEASVFSIHSNIAEGYGRRYLRENIQFNNIALASLAENYSQIFALLASEDINPEWFDLYDKKHFSLENKLISFNKSQIKQLKDKNEWKDDYMLRELSVSYKLNES